MNKNGKGNFTNMTIGGIASVIAGAYYLYGSRDGEARRKQVSAWTLKMKGEVLEKIEKLKTVSEPAYKEIVKQVSEKYAKVDKNELKKVVAEMHATWNKMKSEIRSEIAKKEELIRKESMKKTREKNIRKSSSQPRKKSVPKKAQSIKAAKEKKEQTKMENKPDNTKQK